MGARIRLARRARAAGLGVAILVLAGCGSTASVDTGAPQAGAPAIVVTTPMLGAIVDEVTGAAAQVEVLMPSGVDPHDWQPSAKDVERLNEADVIVANGLHLEESLEEALAKAEASGVPVFEAGDHVEVRGIGQGGADPHLWMDPLAMQAVVEALPRFLEVAAGIDVADRAAGLEQRLAELDSEIAGTLASIPAGRRKLVTGHESMGYFADRYGFTLAGAVIPSLSTQAEVSASELATLKERIEHEGVQVVFAEIGSPSKVARAVAGEAGATVVELPTHRLPEDGSYFTFMRTIASTIERALTAPAT